MKEKLLAAGGIVSALAASTCCIIPLALVSVGVGGAWVGSLRVLAPYQPIFIGIAVVSLGLGFWLVYWRAPANCQDGKCANASAGRFLKSALWIKIILWLGATLVVLSAGVDYGFHLLQ